MASHVLSTRHIESEGEPNLGPRWEQMPLDWLLHDAKQASALQQAPWLLHVMSSCAESTSVGERAEPAHPRGRTRSARASSIGKGSYRFRSLLRSAISSWRFWRGCGIVQRR
jgi:hypothetical protein